MGTSRKIVKSSLPRLGHLITRSLLGRHRVRFLRWLRSRRDLARLEKADVVFISYAKAGRTWTRVMISRLFQVKYNLPDTAVVEHDNLHKLNSRIPVFLFTMGNYIADLYPIKQAPSPYRSKKLIFLARHPADTAVSFYFHLKNRVNPLLKDVKRVPDEAGDVPLFALADGTVHRWGEERIRITAEELV